MLDFATFDTVRYRVVFRFGWLPACRERLRNRSDLSCSALLAPSGASNVFGSAAATWVLRTDRADLQKIGGSLMTDPSGLRLRLL